VFNNANCVNIIVNFAATLSAIFKRGCIVVQWNSAVEIGGEGGIFANRARATSYRIIHPTRITLASLSIDGIGKLYFYANAIIALLTHILQNKSKAQN
jgi:hypothetical protein